MVNVKSNFVKTEIKIKKLTNWEFPGLPALPGPLAPLAEDGGGNPAEGNLFPPVAGPDGLLTGAAGVLKRFAYVFGARGSSSWAGDEVELVDTLPAPTDDGVISEVLPLPPSALTVTTGSGIEVGSFIEMGSSSFF